MNARKFILLAVAALLAVTLAPTAAAETAAGPLGPCSGIVDAYCLYVRDCPPEASCRADYCIVFSDGFCPITRNEILDLIRFG